MKRYSIELTAMQWGLIAVDMGQIRRKSDSSEALESLIKTILDHTSDGEMSLPYNVRDNSDAAPV